MEAVEALARSTVFGRLPREELARLARRLRAVRFARGQRVWSEGDAADGLYLAVRGCLKVSRVGLDGAEVVIHIWRPGHTDGEPALFVPGRERQTDATAVEASEMLFFPREELVAFLAQHTEAMLGMCERLSTLARGQTTQLTRVASQDITGRLASTLADLASSQGDPVGDGIRIAAPLSQGTLAGLVAASRENVNRALHRLASEGLVRLDRGRVVVLDADALRRRSEKT